ncbi:MAG: hypothetical protein HQK84_00680, partial [Nitrospinae bacterium]|nr:hypothetical protein [Nitrospinota bacterium]
MISKKQLLEIEKQKKEKLYSGTGGRREVNSLKGKTTLIFMGILLVLIALVFIYYINSIVPSEETNHQKSEVEVNETKEVQEVQEIK